MKVVIMHRTALLAVEMNIQNKDKKMDYFINSFNDGEVNQKDGIEPYSILLK